MKVLLIGAGGVGEAIAAIAKKQDPKAEWMEQMILADYNLARAKEVSAKLKEPKRFPPEKVDAGKTKDIVALAKKYKVDLIMNGCDPRFNMPIFDAAFEASCMYMDMAMSLSERHAKDPFHKCNVKLGDRQYAKAKDWKKKGLLAICGSGVEPGMVNVFARYAADHLFDEIEELNVRDGANLEVRGYDVAFGFSIWTTIEECLNPPVIWEKEKGWYTTEPFSEPEVFELPEGIGPVEMINVEHEEVLMMPRYFKDKGLKRVTFKYGLGDEFIGVLKILQALGLDKTEKVKVGDCMVSPRDVVGVTAPDPVKVGESMFGKTAAGLWVKGKKDGLERNVYLYQVADNQECMKTIGSQAVVAQTAFTPVIMMELLARGVWKGSGVENPEYFPAEPFIERMERYDFPAGMVEMESEYRKAQEKKALMAGLSSK
ncbi:MAG: saccharopine dehydrogenase NADP-binding domain-containing protein [Spirochaetales bacterium]|nr:saccharopine dehydrogenase NADP-binding domain-containing protein [Spirochaetales bacterium]